MSEHLHITASGVTVQDFGYTTLTSVAGTAMVTQGVLDINGSKGLTLNAVGGEPGVISILADGDLSIRANNLLGANAGTLTHTAADGWKIDGKTIKQLVQEALQELIAE